MADVDSDRWSAIHRLFDEALALDPEARNTWLATARERDASLVAEVELLLQEHAQVERDRFLEDEPERPVHEATLEGQTFGSYTVRSLIGHGGMGTVWLAERTDGRFERRAAIKFLNVSLLGRGGQERFRREGLILGRLTHPGIAQLLDAGVSENRQPFLVLEYIDGVPIDRYCDDHALDATARVELFLEVVNAVAFAHMNLIVHRDIKPSNVLVDREGHVKLLDFGIAKLLEDDDGATVTQLTHAGAAALTPAFAAPEQLTGAAVTTATDVYALGVLLFLLLTGKHPVGNSPRSHAQLIKAIVDGEPPRPSSVAPGDRRGALRGDLDTIVLKALKKEPAGRYGSVTALADDLARWRRHEPISARPDTVAYRVGRFVRRNRVAVAASVVVATALVTALSYSVVQARTARAEARRAEDINAFILSLFDSASPSGGGGSELRVLELLQHSLPRIERELAGQPERESELYLTVGRALAELNAYPESLKAFAKLDEVAMRHGLAATTTTLRARIEAAAAHIGMGDAAGAAPLLDDVDAALAGIPEGVLHAHALNIRSYLYVNQARPADAVKASAASVALFERYAGRTHPDTLAALLSLVRARYHADQCDAAMPEIDDALTRIPPSDEAGEHPLTWLFRGVRARCLGDVNRSDESAAEFERNDSHIRAVFGEASKDYAVELTERSRVELNRGRFDAALRLLDKADAIYTSSGLPDPAHYQVAVRRVLVLLQARRLHDAEPAAARLLKMVTTELPDSPTRVANGRLLAALTRGLRGGLDRQLADVEAHAATANLSVSNRVRLEVLAGWALLLSRDPRAVHRLLAPTIPLLIERGPLGAHELTTARLYMGTAWLDLGDVDQARTYLKPALETHLRLYSSDTPERAELWVGLARVDLQAGDAATARTLAERADEFWRQWDRDSPWAGEAAYWLGRTLEGTGADAAAGEAFRRAGPILRSTTLPRLAALAADARARGRASASAPATASAGP